MKMLGKQMRAACGTGRGDYPVLDTPPTPNENMPSVLHKHSCFEAALPHAAAIERIVIARRVIGCRALCDCHGEGSFSPLPGQLGGREGVPEVKDLPRTAMPICRKKWRFHSQDSCCVPVYTRDLACSTYCQWGRITGLLKETISLTFYFGSNSIWIWNPKYDFC